jgi:hypothetical protein
MRYSRVVPQIRQTHITNYKLVGAAPIVQFPLIYPLSLWAFASIFFYYLASLGQPSKMSDNASHKAVSRHLPLLRGPLLLNNVICLVLSGLCSYHPIYQAQLAFISISSLTGLLDLIHYLIKKRSPSRQGQSTNADQEDVHGASFVAIVDGVLSVALLVIWIIGLVAFSSWDGLIAVIATFGAFIAW